MELAAAVERAGHPLIGRDVGESLGLGYKEMSIKGDLKEVLERGDVIIDFTDAETSIKNLELAALSKIPIVIGSTGFTSEQKERAKDLSQQTPCIISANTSLAMNMIFRIIPDIILALGDGYDIEILGTHHRKKPDLPSGTALRMGEIVARTLQKRFEDIVVYERKGMIGERKKDEIGMQVIRAGDTSGEHKILFAGNGERLELSHRADSLNCYAMGAIKAAQWLVGRANGLYGMDEVFESRSF
jgi:4-hydroxy-tetrahydrodipicolinate reductase